MKYTVISLILCGLFSVSTVSAQRIQSSATSGRVSPKKSESQEPWERDEQPVKATSGTTKITNSTQGSAEDVSTYKKTARKTAGSTSGATAPARAGGAADRNRERNAEDLIREVAPRDHVIIKNALNDYKSITWSRDVYRVVDIENATNAAFFYPEETDAQQANLFSLLFGLVRDNLIKAYKFNLQNKAGEDQLEEISFKDMLDNHSIPYTMGAGRTISVRKYDLPTNEVKSYYVREKWIFDERTGRGDVRIVAICPVLHRPESYEFSDSPVLKIPLFWLSFDDISPYLVRAVNHTAVSDVTKHSPNITLFDIMRNRIYNGDIYQIGDRVLPQYYDDPVALKNEQERLDKELNVIQEKFNKIR